MHSNLSAYVQTYLILSTLSQQVCNVIHMHTHKQVQQIQLRQTQMCTELTTLGSPVPLLPHTVGLHGMYVNSYLSSESVDFALGRI